MEHGAESFPWIKALKKSEQELKEQYLEPLKRFNTTRWRPKLLRENGMPYGKCIFLKEKGCIIHDVKPLQCRTYSRPSGLGVELNAYFAVKYFLDIGDPQSVREYAQYIESGGYVLEGAHLNDLIPDKEKLKKILEHEDEENKGNPIQHIR